MDACWYDENVILRKAKNAVSARSIGSKSCLTYFRDESSTFPLRKWVRVFKLSLDAVRNSSSVNLFMNTRGRFQLPTVFHSSEFVLKTWNWVLLVEGIEGFRVSRRSSFRCSSWHPFEHTQNYDNKMSHISYCLRHLFAVRSFETSHCQGYWNRGIEKMPLQHETAQNALSTWIRNVLYERKVNNMHRFGYLAHIV